MLLIPHMLGFLVHSNRYLIISRVETRFPVPSFAVRDVLGIVMYTTTLKNNVGILFSNVKKRVVQKNSIISPFGEIIGYFCTLLLPC